MTRILIALFLLMALVPTHSFAEEDEAVLVVENENTPVKKWLDAENSLIEPLSKKDKETFFILRNKHSVIRTLRVVRDDINVAVKSCAKENADLSDEIKNRFSEWENAVLPILEEADDFLQQELKEQSVVSVSDAKKVLKLNDKAYKFSQLKIKKQPVSDEKSCKGLIKSMDKTENDLIGLLQTILLPEEVVRERIEQEKKASASK